MKLIASKNITRTTKFTSDYVFLELVKIQMSR